MANNDKAFVWSAMDLSDGEETLEKLAVRFQNVEAAESFKKIFNDARVFNQKARAGEEEELVWAELVEDVEEKEVDDIETNKTADPEADWDCKRCQHFSLESKHWSVSNFIHDKLLQLQSRRGNVMSN